MTTKRAFDIVTSAIGLIVFSPLIVVTGIAVWVSLGWPVLYSPRRAGRHGQSFTLRKFRTMKEVIGGPRSIHSGDDDPRLTRVGKLVRRLKLDELPQLWNVIRGEMSIVGPRPEALEYTERYTEEQMEILSVRPGITDFASIEFSNLGKLLRGDDPDRLYMEKVWDRKMELRMKYVRERSFWLDLKLIGLTLRAIFRR